MKTKLLIFSLIAAILIPFSCSKDNDTTPTPVDPDTPGDTIPVPDPDPEPIVPTSNFGTYVFADGSVLIESDNGYETVNGLVNAIENFGDTLVVVSATGDTVNCNNVFLLQNGGNYYIEGKWVITKNVTIKAYEEGEYPSLQIMADEIGETNADMIRIEANVVIDGVYILGKEAMTDAHQQRIFRIDGQDCRLVLNNCFADYCRNFFIRMDNTGSKIYLQNSTFRNMKYNCSSNGRLIDSRGNGADSVVIENCLVYHNLGLITRYDGSTINYLRWSNNTFYNCGSVPEFEYPVKVVVENNIFANVGWRNAGTAIEIDPETGLLDHDDIFWDISDPTETELANAEVVIRNNNVYNTSEMSALYAKYPDTTLEPTTLSPGGQTLLDNGRLIFENNISEVLTFDYPAPINYDFIDLYFSNTAAPDETYADVAWFVDEDGINGVKVGNVFTYNYASSFKSATASTTGGKLGAQL